MVSNNSRRLWHAAAIGCLVGVTGLACFGHVARAAASLHHRAETPAATARQTPRTLADTDSKTRTSTTEAPASRYDRVVEVPCDPDALAQAIVHANGDGGGALGLAKHCTYNLTAAQPNTFRQLDGLPVITQPIAVYGNGATIQHTAVAFGPAFRIFDVGTGGYLTLNDVIVKYGAATGTGTPSGGGGLLVQPGGRAHVQDSTFAFNRYFQDHED